MKKKETHYSLSPELVSAIALPNYDIISVFKNQEGNLVTLKGNFKFFVERQIEYNEYDLKDAVNNDKIKKIIKKIVPTFIEEPEHTKNVNKKNKNSEKIQYVITLDKETGKSEIEKKEDLSLIEG